MPYPGPVTAGVKSSPSPSDTTHSISNVAFTVMPRSASWSACL
jgi:hypothetical protein